MGYILNTGGSLTTHILGFLDDPQVQQIKSVILQNCTPSKFKFDRRQIQVFVKEQQNIQSSRDPNDLLEVIHKNSGTSSNKGYGEVL